MRSTLTGDVAEQPVPLRDPLSHTTIHKYHVQSSEVGATGFVDGGTVLDWVHRAAHATATRWSAGRCVAASLANFHLDRPIGVGDLVEVRACLTYTGNSSMHILVTVVTGDPTDTTPAQTAQCPIVFVAVDEVGDPTTVPPWTPVTMLELQRHRQARVRIRTRRLVDDAIAGQSTQASQPRQARPGTSWCPGLTATATAPCTAVVSSDGSTKPLMSARAVGLASAA